MEELSENPKRSEGLSHEHGLFRAEEKRRAQKLGRVGSV